MSTTEKEEASLQKPHSVVPTLRLLYSGEEGAHSSLRRYVLQRGATHIGRKVIGGGICLEHDRRLSGLHATIQVARGDCEMHLIDADSTNGTFVNGDRVKECVLHEGDLLRTGDSFLLVRYDITPLSADATGAVPEIIGSSPAIQALRQRILTIGPSDATVLVQGETGTGKEVAAKALHRISGRSGKFLAVNCGALAEGLAESQLFGHVAGAFTGSRGQSPGLFRAAPGGTVFLDEIGELSLTLQVKLLRALQEREVVPVGATDPVAFDARIIAATNRDLRTEVQQRTFRNDLHARLEVISLRLPPLRERREDILPLLMHALALPQARFTPRLVSALLLHSWPYNVREVVEKIAKSLSVYGVGAPVLDLDLVADLLGNTAPASSAPSMAETSPASETDDEDRGPPPTPEQLASLVKETEGNVSRIAAALHRSRKHVRRLLVKHGLR